MVTSFQPATGSSWVTAFVAVHVCGSQGVIGRALVHALGGGGHRVVRLVRSGGGGGDEVRWDPSAWRIEAERLEGIDAVVHLAGEGIADGRWSAAKKARIMDSRKQGTELLARTLAGLQTRPRVMVSTSAIGYYGDRGNELLRESSDPGDLFLSKVCVEWEAAAEPARAAGIRVVHPRIGIVLTLKGGALGQTLPIFKLGLGGRIGSGRQYWAWVSIDDVIGATIHCIDDESLNGPVNVVAPDPPTNAEYTKVLGRVLNRPTIFPLPAPAAKLMLGEVADELLLPSARVEPERLKETGYAYRNPELEGAFHYLLGR